MINVERVQDALIGPHEGFSPPERLIITTPRVETVAADPGAGMCIIVRDVDRGEAIRVAEDALAVAP